MDYLTSHTSLSPIRHGFAPVFINYKKGALDSQPQVIKFTHVRWFSPASSTTKTGRHDIAEILLKVALNTINQIKSNIYISYSHKPTWYRDTLYTTYNIYIIYRKCCVFCFLLFVCLCVLFLILATMLIIATV